MTNKNSNHQQADTGFQKHVKLESIILTEVAKRELMRSAPETDYLGRSRKPKFIENIGTTELFSMADLENLYQNASIHYGDERVRYARSLLEEISQNGNRRNLASPPEPNVIGMLKRDFPNFLEAIEHIECAAALSRLSDQAWFQMRPMLLLGPAGVGKTAFAQAFSTGLKVPFKRLDVGTMSTASIITGLSMSWSTGHVGDLLRMMAASPVANPIIMLDEVDKMSGHDIAPLEPTVLSLLEQESSRSFRDEGLSLRYNVSHVLWLGTANDLEQMSEPLRSRFTIVHVNEPSREQAPAVIASIYRKIRAGNPWGAKFPANLDGNVIDRLIGYSPRALTHILVGACGKAAVRGDCMITEKDIPSKSVGNETRRIGFI